MGKVLRVLVILLALLSIGAVVFAYMNYNKREILIGRAHLLEDMFVKVAATFEAEDIPETPQPSYPQRDISAVTSREIENPERSAFWDSYNHKYEPAATPPPIQAPPRRPSARAAPATRASTEPRAVPRVKRL